MKYATCTRNFFLLAMTSLLIGGFGCASEPAVYRSAVTHEECEPDLDSLVDEGEEEGDGPYCWGNNGHGNNADGVDSSNPGGGHGGPNGEVDESCPDAEAPECVDDEIHEQHQEERECVVPAGCDESGCCEDEPENEPEPAPEDEPEQDPEFPIVE